jgi:general secretion pathway protein A
MYTSFYGLSELPFELSPNPKYLLLTGRHREALANLQYGISAGKSVTLLLGEAGTGKTTLVQAALASDACRGASIVHLANPMLTREEFVEFLARAFDLPEEARRSKTAMLAELEREMHARHERGQKTALVIDEAQCLSRELLEEVRLLSNIETPGKKLLPIVLAGQPEFAERLNLPSLVQLKQRIALRCTLGLLDLSETAGYISGRLKIAGANGHEIFTREALQVIHQRSGGIPRTISVICDNAMVSGFATGQPTIGPAVIHEVCNDFDLATPARPVSTAASSLGENGRPPAAEPPAAPGTTVNPADRLFADYGKRRRFSFF